jgi:hypothetical protein
MRRFLLGVIIAFLAFIIGITAAMLIGKINPFQRSHSGCASRSWNPPPPPPAPVKPVAAPDAPQPPPPPAVK